MVAFRRVVLIVLVIDGMLLLAMPLRALRSRSDLAGDGMAMGYAVIGAVVGAAVVGGLALGWRAASGWVRTVLGALIAVVTLILLAVVVA